MTSFSVGCYLKTTPLKEQCCEGIKLYYQSKSLKTVVKTIRKNHSELGIFNAMQVHRIFKWFEELGSVEDRWHAKTRCRRSART